MNYVHGDQTETTDCTDFKRKTMLIIKGSNLCTVVNAVDVNMATDCN